MFVGLGDCGLATDEAYSFRLSVMVGPRVMEALLASRPFDRSLTSLLGRDLLLAEVPVVDRRCSPLLSEISDKGREMEVWLDGWRSRRVDGEATALSAMMTDWRTSMLECYDVATTCVGRDT